ncbi:phosphoglycerate kinase [Candidatus Woesebacteria bacterium]|nr:phosphoglycerate kinase [Candidatus Woesebacteria bacterium]
MKKKTIRDIKLEGKRVLLKVDYNVSLLDGFRIGDDTRIKQTLPTIEYLLSKDCTLFFVSHLGRPKGKKQSKYSLKPVAKHLQKILDRKVNFIEDYIDGKGIEIARKAKKQSINLLENIRFYSEEEANDPKFAKKLASLAEVFVNDAFGAAHRAHASSVGVTSYLPSVAGFLLEKEVDIINKALTNPKHPFVAIVGGAKAEDKITCIGRLLEKADVLIIGGGVANTFLKAWGYDIGESLVSYEMVELAKKLFWKASRSQTQMLLPTDVVLGHLKRNVHNGVVTPDRIPKDMQALDIGPRTQAEFGAIIAKAKTIIWNGPMGVYENPKFSVGTEFVYHAIAENRSSLSIVGGGDTLAAINKKEYLKAIDHISTGGGAMLEFIEKGTLPAIDALQNK